MTWLPRIRIIEWCDCQDDGEAEGWSLTICWCDWQVEIAIARHNRRLQDDARG